MLVALLEDADSRADRMLALLTESFLDLEVVRFVNARTMIEWLPSNLGGVSVLCLDHDLVAQVLGDGSFVDAGTGRDVVDALVTLAPKRPVLVHSANGLAVAGMLTVLESAGWQAASVEPFNGLEWIDSTWLPVVSQMLEMAV